MNGIRVYIIFLNSNQLKTFYVVKVDQHKM